jgi:hypothetical protein
MNNEFDRRDAASPSPIEILGLASPATADEVRLQYLKLVKEFPPEREPERFREIHQAYADFCNPLGHAIRILDSIPNSREWNEIMEEEAQRPPRLGVDVLLSLGNKQR